MGGVWGGGCRRVRVGEGDVGRMTRRVARRSGQGDSGQKMGGAGDWGGGGESVATGETALGARSVGGGRSVGGRWRGVPG